MNLFLLLIVRACKLLYSILTLISHVSKPAQGAENGRILLRRCELSINHLQVQSGLSMVECAKRYGTEGKSHAALVASPVRVRR